MEKIDEALKHLRVALAAEIKAETEAYLKWAICELQITLAECERDGMREQVELITVEPADMDEHTRRLIEGDDGDDIDDAEMYREDDPEPDSNRTLGLVTIQGGGRGWGA